jgi:hypothetical protein
MKVEQSVCAYIQELELNGKVRNTLLALAKYLKELEVVKSREDKKAVPNPVAYFNGSPEVPLTGESTLQGKDPQTYETFRRALDDLLKCYEKAGFYGHERITEDFAVRAKKYPEILKEVSFMDELISILPETK